MTHNLTCNVVAPSDPNFAQWYVSGMSNSKNPPSGLFANGKYVCTTQAGGSSCVDVTDPVNAAFFQQSSNQVVCKTIPASSTQSPKQTFCYIGSEQQSAMQTCQSSITGNQGINNFFHSQ